MPNNAGPLSVPLGLVFHYTFPVNVLSIANNFWKVDLGDAQHIDL